MDSPLLSQVLTGPQSSSGDPLFKAPSVMVPLLSPKFWSLPQHIQNTAHSLDSSLMPYGQEIVLTKKPGQSWGWSHELSFFQKSHSCMDNCLVLKAAVLYILSDFMFVYRQVRLPPVTLPYSWEKSLILLYINLHKLCQFWKQCSLGPWNF